MPPGSDDLFLVLWVILEVIGCFVLSPYSAVRRVLGIVVARRSWSSGSRRGRAPIPLAPPRWAATFGVGLGLFYFAIDYEEAVVDRRAAGDAAERVRLRPCPSERTWFAGRWGFRYHAEQAGLTALRPAGIRSHQATVLAVVENKVAEEPRVVIEPADARRGRHARLRCPSLLPPLRHGPDLLRGQESARAPGRPRQVVHVYQVNRPFTPSGLIPPWLGPKDRAVGAKMQIGKARR